MTTIITRQNIRRELYEQIPGLGFNGTADSIAAGSITDAFALRDSTLGPNHYRGNYIYRPDLSTDDRIKKASTLTNTTGLLAHSGSNYSDTSDGNYEIVGLLHPDELNACIERAIQRVYFEYMSPLQGDCTDGDMDANNTTSWTGTDATVTKNTTASSIFSGIRSLRVANTGASGYAQSVTIRVIPNTYFYASAVLRSDVGTASLVVRDITNGATIGTSSTSAEEQFVHLWMKETVPSTCEEIAIRLTGSGASDDIYWNHAVFYQLDRKILPAPSWLDEPWKFQKLRQASYTKSISNQSDGGYDDAMSRVFKDWLQPSMFSLDPLHIDANPYQVQLMRTMPSEELWLGGKRPFSDLESLSTESSTTRAPQRELFAYCKDEVGRVLRKRYPHDKRWDVLIGEAAAEIEVETKSQTEIPLQPIKREHSSSI